MIMYLLDKQQNIVQAISDGLLEAKMTEEINTADKLVFSLVQTKRLPSEIYFVCIPATRGDAFLMFKIISESVKDDHIEYTCIESAYDELKSYTYIRDVRPQDKTASEMLQIALANTRWELGHSEETVRKRTNFYYISTLEAIQKVVELFKVELTFTVVIDPITNRIVRRQVNLYSQQGERTGKRFEYGSNLLSVTREESSEDLVTALVGRGKGEQLDDGNDDTVDGYGRRIMFTDVIWSKANGNPTDKPAGQEYVEDKEATKLYGFDDGKPRIGIAVFEDIEDVNQLINATWAALQVAKRPKVSFKASALDIGDLGLGDTVAIIRHELNIEYFTRVYKVEHDLLDKNNNVIELGDDFSEKSLTSYVASVKQAQEETSRVANIALTSANGKNKNFYSNVKPTTAAEGDNLFLDLGNGETEYYVWRNGNWELILSTAEIKTTQKEVDKALEDIEEVRSKANEAYNSAQNAHSTADSIYASFMDMQNSLSTELAEIDTRAQLGVQDALDNVTKLAKNYDDFTRAVNGRIDLSASESAKRIAEVSASTKELSDRAKQQQKAIADLTTSINGVRGQYATLDGRVSRFNAGIDGLNAQLRDAKGQLAAIKVTADGTVTNLANAKGDIANLKTRANEIEQQMLSKVGNDVFESFRSSTAQALRSKLTASDLNEYARSSEVEQTANGLRASIIGVDGKIDNLKLGGRNYLQGSLDFTWPTGIGQLNVTPTFEMQGETKVAHLNSQYFGGIYTKWGGAFPNGELQVGDDYTLSFDAKGTGVFKAVKSESEASDGSLSGTSLTSNWKRYSVSGKINSLNKAYIIYFNGGYDAYIKRVKIEKGNKPTDYTQAPEDIESQFNSVNNTLKAYKTDFDLFKDGMSLRVAEIDRVNTRINDLNIQNLVYNSEFSNGAEGWDLFGVKNGKTILYADNEWDTYKGSKGLAFRNTIDSSYLSATSKLIRVTQYDKLSASVWMHVTDNITNGNCKARMEIVFYKAESNGYLDRSSQATQEVRNISNGHQQLLYCNDISLPSGTKYVAMRLITNGVGNVIFNQPMMSFSSSYVPYTQNTGLLETLSGRYSALNVRVDSINSTVANKADKSYVDQRANEITAAVSNKASWAYVNQKASEISSVVANKADASYVDQKADQWQLILQNMQIGGTNLLKGTSKDFQSISVPTTGWIEGIRYDTSRTLNKTRYTLSFEAKSVFNGQKIACYLWHGDLGGDNRVRGVIESNGVERDNSVDGYWEVTLNDSWKKYYITYKISPDDKRKSVIIGRRFADSSPRPAGSVYVRSVKLEEGTKATDWSPDPEDTTVAITAVKNELNEAINLRVQKGDLLSQINMQANRTLIQSKKIYLDADSVAFSGRAFIPSAAITSLNADKITAGTLNAARVNIINLDVRNITGDKTEFVRSFWRSAYGSYVNIDYSGMRVTYGNTTTQFYDHGMLIQAVGEKIGGIGWQGMQEMPGNYQGLLFWLDGGGDYMAWAARDNGNYSMNPKIKMSWFRNEWKPRNSNTGFNFYDPVTFNKPVTFGDSIHPVSGTSDGMALRISSTNYNGHTYPTLSSKSGKAGIMIGDWDIFFIFNNKVYPLGGWNVPVEIDDSGSIKRWIRI